MGEVVPKCGIGSLMKIIVWGEKCVRKRTEKGYYVLAVLFVIDEFSVSSCTERCVART
jgi:hypothetical protein